ARRFETEYVGQQGARRTITETLDLGWHLLSDFAPDELKRVSAEHIARHHQPNRPDDTANPSPVPEDRGR
ncbi:MAG: hypothetical protein LH477_01115, partial [Nocardioides sp.]|nr:hypothetical protein [Nocardioides sp.]